MKYTLSVLAAVLSLAACGGGNDSETNAQSEALDLLQRQRVIYSHRPNVTPGEKVEWNLNWPAILRLEPRPSDIACLQPKDSPAWNACVLEVQTLTHPWIWE